MTMSEELEAILRAQYDGGYNTAREGQQLLSAIERLAADPLESQRIRNIVDAVDAEMDTRTAARRENLYTAARANDKSELRPSEPRPQASLKDAAAGRVLPTAAAHGAAPERQPDLAAAVFLQRARRRSQTRRRTAGPAAHPDGRLSRPRRRTDAARRRSGRPQTRRPLIRYEALIETDKAQGSHMHRRLLGLARVVTLAVIAVIAATIAVAATTFSSGFRLLPRQK